MSKRTVLVVDLQNDYLPTGQFPLVGIEPAIDNAARVIADARAKDDKVVHVRHEFPGADDPFFAPGRDRKSGEIGKSGSVRVEVGVRRIHKNKTRQNSSD